MSPVERKYIPKEVSQVGVANMKGSPETKSWEEELGK